jgi:hypothetical protein
MPIKWRTPGGVMGVIDLRRLDNDQIVIHFGGQLSSVDAYTFGNSLVSLADTIRAINETINPGQNIEVRLDALGPGSFRAVIKKVKKGLGGFLSRAPENAFWAILAVWLIDPTFRESRKIEVFDDRVEISEGGDTIIISREAFDQFQNTRNNPRIERSVRKTFETIERDESIENFGITPSLDDPEPLIQIPRNDFHKLATGEAIVDGSKRRLQHARSVFIVLKPWIDASKHKWSFEWNGVPVSAYLTDQDFLERVKNHEIRFGNGDALDATIAYFQDFDENLGVWVNDTQTFAVSEVYAYLPKDGTRFDLK